jgi:hypothetical protein
MGLPCIGCICLPACQNSKIITPLVEKCSIIALYLTNKERALDAIDFFKPGYYEYLTQNPRDSLMKENIMKILTIAERVRGEL